MRISAFKILLVSFLVHSCTSVPTKKMDQIKLITLDPGHFHAGLIQKTMYPQVDSTVYVYAPEGQDLILHLERVDQYNNRPEQPTSWKEEIYVAPDYFEKMLAQKPGNVVVLAGNNRNKSRYISESLKAGLNVLTDKPAIIYPSEFDSLVMAVRFAEKNGLLLYDIMTERFEITSILQRRLALSMDVFGEQILGTELEPGVEKESVHHFYKEVSGKPLKRPGWFMDAAQQGDGVVDVTTHLVDLVQWTCFPDEAIDYKKDIQVLNAVRSSTPMTKSQFQKITGNTTFPDYLNEYKTDDTTISVQSNGEIIWKLKNLVARVKVRWDFQAPVGAGDTHFSRMRGSKSDLVIRQGAEQNFKPVLYIEPNAKEAGYETSLRKVFEKIASDYPGMELKSAENGWEIVIPEKYREGHEAHFARVTEKFIAFLTSKKLPVWEMPNLLSKYYTTTKALELAGKTKP